LPLAFLDRVSVFETMRVYKGRVFQFSEHLSRLEASCRALGEKPPLSREGLKSWLEASVKESGHKEATLRVSVHWAENGAGRLVLFVGPFEGHPRAWYEEGVSLRTAVSRRWTLRAQDPQVKCSQYVSGVLAMLDKGELKAHELLFFGSGGTVAEGTVSNLFIVKEKCLLTPSVASGILKGVTRGIVIGLARKRGWKVRETELTRHEFYTADECFLTNTSSEVLPVVSIDGRAIGGARLPGGQGKPGPLTRTLGDDFKGLR
jgi:branched-chain amino acid aminotransferase